MKIFKLEDFEFVVGDELEAYNKIWVKFHIMGLNYSNEFKDKCDEIQNMDDLIESIINLATQQLEKCLDVAIETLIGYEIWNYNVDRFCADYYIQYFNLENHFVEYANAYNSIIEHDDQLQFYRNQQQANRSRWYGGGFGMRGAISGAVNQTTYQL